MKTRRRGVPALTAAATCWQGSDCRNNARKMKNILITILKNTVAIMFHSSSNMSEIKNDNNEARDSTCSSKSERRFVEQRC